MSCKAAGLRPGALAGPRVQKLVLHGNELPQRRAGRHRPDLRLRRGSDSGRYPLRKAGRVYALATLNKTHEIYKKFDIVY